MADAVVEVALAGHLVAPIGDLAHQLRHFIGDRAQDEEGRLDVVLVEEIESLAGIRLDPPLEAIPAVGPNNTLERRDVEVGSHRILCCSRSSERI